MKGDAGVRWEFVVALMLAVPVFLFPAAIVWYANGGALYRDLKRMVCCRLRRTQTRTIEDRRRTKAQRDIAQGVESDEDGVT